MLATLEVGLAILALTVTLVYQRWTRAAVSPHLVTGEMWTKPHSFFFFFFKPRFRKVLWNEEGLRVTSDNLSPD